MASDVSVIVMPRMACKGHRIATIFGQWTTP